MGSISLIFFQKMKITLLALVFATVVLMIMKELHVPAPVVPFLNGWHHLVAARARKSDIIHSSKTQQKKKRHVYYNEALS